MKTFKIFICVIILCLLTIVLYFTIKDNSLISNAIKIDSLNTNKHSNTSLKIVNNSQNTTDKPLALASNHFSQADSPTESSDQPYIVECNLDVKNDPESVTEFNKEINSQLNISKPDEQLASILFFNNKLSIHAENKNSRNNALINYFRKSPDEPLSFHRLLTQCTQASYSYCNQEFYDSITTIDKDNGSLWLTLASIYIKENKIELVQSALLKASYAKNFNDYYFDTIKLHRNTIEKYAPESINEQLISGVGYAAALPLGYSHALEYCNTAQLIKTQELCLQIGLTMEQSSKTRFHTGLGLSLQRIYHDRQGNQDTVEALTIKTSQIYDFTLLMKAANLLSYDNHLTEQWLNIALEYNEASASDFLVSEAILLSKNPNYQPCPISQWPHY
ncbi:hypothetical protein [Thalassotalea profundi]|uniref:Sel1 repeat family protein n=1 Tax=Thalassotalea profundi TaxID=2036687 RepID=A0ABQ3IL08_9GAMM|nr:hypothetical protein [Thalassotalea profundi]GHE85844.1 hypothetical protein GCM10011501_13740 [Thalassotalea profundi]